MLELGARLGRYDVISSLGAGGMGEVYCARDTELDRVVAVKVLPAGALADEAARKRFRREALALSRLAHPHLATLYDFATADGIDFLVMELVPGSSLEAALAKGPFSEKEAVRLGAQIVKGLVAAHERGVIHRDLKPSNIRLTPDGLMRVVDFGLARVEAGADEETTESASGIVAGSPPYMSPEQLVGKGVDARSDVYGVGLVLYQMVTGRRPFAPLRGPRLVAAILSDRLPSPREVNPAISAGLEALILKAADKNPNLRYQTAKELLVDLERLSGGQLPTSALEAPVKPAGLASFWTGSVRWRALALGGGLGGAGLVTVLLAVSRLLSFPLPKASPVPPLTYPITSSRALERHPALSPDGRQLAYVSNDAGETFDLYVKDVDSANALRLTTSAASECCLAWSPDQRTIAFLRLEGSEAVLLTMPAMGGAEERRLVLTPWFGSALSYSPDGRFLAFSDRSAPGGPFVVKLLELATGVVRQLTTTSPDLSGDAFPKFSPDGRHVALARLGGSADVASADIYVVPVEGGEPRRLTRDDRFVGDLEWTPDGGSIFFFSDRTNATRLWQVALSGGDPSLVWPGGDPFPSNPFAEALTDVSFSFRFSAARSRSRLALTQRQYDTNIFRLDPRGTGIPSRQPLIGSSQVDESPQVSPDGRRIAFSSRRSGHQEIWVCGREGSPCESLARTPNGGTPRWAPDSQSIAYDEWSTESGHSAIFTIDVRTLAVRRLTSSGGDDVVPSFSRDGRSLYFASNRTGSWQVFRTSVQGGEAQQITREGGFAAFEAPRGDSIYYTKFNVPGLFQIPRTGGEERQFLDLPRCWGHWAVAPEGIYLLDAREGQRTRLQFAGFGGDTLREVAILDERPPCAESSLASSPDGRFVLWVGVEEGSDIVRVDEP